MSIVTISFNQARYLERAIRSVAAQDYPDIEYIIVDAGSTDGSLDIIAKNRAVITTVISGPDRGPADGLNNGFSAATGEICGCLNADDEYLPGAISAAVTAIRRYKADVAYGDGYFVDGVGRCIRRCMSTGFSLRRLKLGSVVIMQQSTFFRADAFREVGGFNVANGTCWDGELIYDLAMRGKTIVHVGSYWSVFRLHGEGISGSGRLASQYLRDQERMFGALRIRHGRMLPLLQMGARVEKYLRSPRILACRLAEAVFGPPSVELLKLQ